MLRVDMGFYIGIIWWTLLQSLKKDPCPFGSANIIDCSCSSMKEADRSGGHRLP